MSLPLKTLILAAGQGSRLRPLTSSCPKPLLPILGVPMLSITAKKIARQLGVKDISINAFYLKDKIATFCEKNNFNCSSEQERIDTGGAVDLLKPWIKDQHLFVHSGDVVSAMDIKALADTHFAASNSPKPLATIYVVPHVAGETAIDVQGGQLKGFGSGNYTFANAYILSPEFIKQVPQGKSGIIETFKKLLNDGGNIRAVNWNGYWKNLNQIEDYVRLHAELLQNPHLLSELYIEDCLKEKNANYHFNQQQFLRQKTDADNHRVGDWVVAHGSLPKQQALTLGRCLIMQDAVITQPTIHNQIVGDQYCIDIDNTWFE